MHFLRFNCCLDFFKTMIPGRCLQLQASPQNNPFKLKAACLCYLDVKRLLLEKCETFIYCIFQCPSLFLYTFNVFHVHFTQSKMYLIEFKGQTQNACYKVIFSLYKRQISKQVNPSFKPYWACEFNQKIHLASVFLSDI